MNVLATLSLLARDPVWLDPDTCSTLLTGEISAGTRPLTTDIPDTRGDVETDRCTVRASEFILEWERRWQATKGRLGRTAHGWGTGWARLRVPRGLQDEPTGAGEHQAPQR